MRSRLPALLSTVPLIAVLIVSYVLLNGKVDYQPIFLNGKFQYWTRDVKQGDTKPYCWQIDRFQSANDVIAIYPTEVQGRKCLGVELYQDGKDNANPWVSVHIRQEVRGQALRSLFSSKVGIWIYANFSYAFDRSSMRPKNAFGLEVNDGKYMIWFIFSDGEEMNYTLPNHRIVVQRTPIAEWSYHEVDIASEYRKLTDKQPDSISVMLLMGLSKDLPGKAQGYFASIVAVEK